MPLNPISLFELNTIIKSTIQENIKSSFWIIGEISEIKVNTNGHCYLELVEKDEKKSCLIAKAKATIWSSSFRMIKPYFETSTGKKLIAGIKIMVRVCVDFHELYGFNLSIVDIEPSFTVGEMARKKMEIIKKLADEGVIEMNKELDFNRPLNRVAVISSPTAAGYGDFVDQIINNPFGYKFYLKLFPALMQGDGAEQSIINALERIHRNITCFDTVVIIRGGGSQADMDCYNNYWLSLHVAQFPIPVLTGIGHEQDECIVDIVANTRLKTPTAVAEFLINIMHKEELTINDLADQIIQSTNSVIQNEKGRLTNRVLNFITKTKSIVTNNELLTEKLILKLKYRSGKAVENFHRNIYDTLKNIEAKSQKKLILEKQKHLFNSNLLHKSAQSFIKTKSLHITLLENKSHYLNPFEILKRGYSITKLNNVVVKSASVLKPGDILENIFAEGKASSKVIDDNKNG